MRTRQSITETSPAAAGTSAGTLQVHGFDECDSLTIIGALVGATGGVLNVYVQTSYDGGVTWYDFASFTQLTAGNAAVKLGWHVSRDSERTTITTLGVGAVPVLAAGTIMAGGWGNSFRLCYVAGVSTSAGAALVVHFLGNRK